MQKRHIQISQPDTGEEEWLALREPLQTGWLTQGPKVAAFEKAFAARHGVPHALAVTSATTGLHLALAALGIGPGDEVIVPAFTWVSTANCVVYCGATPVFADVERQTFNLDIADVARRVTPRTKALIAVHLFGLCVDTVALRSVLPASVDIVEDAACAAGGALGDRSAGRSRPCCGVFLSSAKIDYHRRGRYGHDRRCCIGGAGSRSSQSRRLGRPSRSAITAPHPYIMADFDCLGFNYRMTDLQGAVGLVQLENSTGFIDERSRWAAFYRRELAKLDWLDLPGRTQSRTPRLAGLRDLCASGRAPLPRNQIMEFLQDGHRDATGNACVHMLGYYRNQFRLRPDDYPAARDCGNHSMAIPLHNRMTEDDYAYVAEALHAL